MSFGNDFILTLFTNDPGIARRAEMGHLRTCSGGKSLVCFYHESGLNPPTIDD